VIMQPTVVPTVFLVFGYSERLANGLLPTVHDSVVKHAVIGETEGRRGVSSTSCSISPAMQQPSY